MTQSSRREFLGKTAGTVAAMAAVPAFNPYWTSSAQGAPFASQDRLRVGCIGLGGMGTGDAHDHNRFADIIAVCDVDANHRERARNDEKIGKGKAESVEDYRRVLENKNVDVVSIVTPDHWRLFLRAVNMAHKGLLGDIKKITCGINGSPTGGPFAKAAPPANLNWDMWLGQAPKVDYIQQRCHNDFRWWYEYSGGKFTDWGAHHIDIALWAANQTEQGTGPVEVDGSDCTHPVEMKDGNPLMDDRFNTSHDFNIIHRFANGMEIHVTSRGDNGLLIEGTKGRIFVNRERITGKPIEEQWDKDVYGDAELQALYKGKPHEGHKANFYRCIAEGGLPVSDVYSHLQTMNLCHLSAIAGRLKRKLKWNATTERIEGDDVAAAMQARVQRAGFEIPKV